MKRSILRHKLSPKKGNISFNNELEQVKLISNLNDVNVWLEQQLKSILQPHVDNNLLSEDECARILKFIFLQKLLMKKSCDKMDRLLKKLKKLCDSFQPENVKMVDYLLQHIKNKRSPKKRRS